MLCVKQNILVSRKDERKWYSSSVMDVGDKEVLISFPKLNGVPVRVVKDDSLEITFSDNGVRYLFESCYSQKIGEVLVIEQPRLLEKIELRRYPRVPVSMELLFSEISCRDDVCNDFKKGLIVDISGNGMRLKVDQLFMPSTYMTVRFNLQVMEKTVPVSMECKIVRIVVDDQKEPVEYQLGAEFSRIDNKDQKYIIDFVYNRLNETSNQD